MAKLLGIKELCEFWQAIKSALNLKVDKESGKGLSSNDFTTAEKNKLANIESGAEVNVQADWTETDTSSDAYIKHKPSIPTMPDAATEYPLMDGTASVGTSNKYAREDHVHPHDDSKVNKSGDTMDGDLTLHKSAAPSLYQTSDVSGRIDAPSVSANTNLGRIQRYDSNGEPVFYTETFRTTGNQLYTSFIQRRYAADGSTNINHGFYLRINNDGSRAVTFPDDASRRAWVFGLFKSSNLTSNTTVSSSAWGNAPLQFRDTENTEIGTVGAYFWTNGQQGTIIRARRVANSTAVNNELHLKIDADGTRSIGFSDASIWRNALGINNSVTVKTASSVSVASATAWASGTTLCNSGSLAAGTYVVRGFGQFATNSTGRRYLAIMNSDSATSALNSMVDSRNAVNGGGTYCNVFGIVTLTTAMTLYLRVLQNSGAALNCNGRLEILKIH